MLSRGIKFLECSNIGILEDNEYIPLGKLILPQIEKKIISLTEIFIFWLLFGNEVSYIVQDDLKLTSILLPWPPEYWDYRP